MPVPFPGSDTVPGDPAAPRSRRLSAALFFALLASCAAILILAGSLSAKADQTAATGQAPGQVVASGGGHPVKATPAPAGVSTSTASDQNPKSRIQDPKSPARTGGPDAYGYVFADDRDPGGPVYSWQPGVNRVPDDAWVATPYNGTPLDDGVASVTLPFSITVYGVLTNVVNISTNGNLHFGTPDNYWPDDTDCLPSPYTYSPKGLVAPLWQDLVVPDDTVGNAGVYTTVIGTEPNLSYVVEWRGVYEYGSPSTQATFETLVTEDGRFYFQYQQLSLPDMDGSNAIIGTQNFTGTVGLPYECHEAGSILPNRAIRYRVETGVFVDPRSQQRGGAPGATVTYTETLLNRTGITNSFTITPSGSVWTTTVNPQNTGPLPPSTSMPFTVSVQIPPTATIGMSDTAAIDIASELPDPGTFTATVVLTTSVSSYGVEFDPPEVTGSGRYGAPITYTTDLYNRSGQTNDFVLSVENGAQWPTTVYPTHTTALAADASTPVTITVYVPAGATLGAHDTAGIDAVGQQPQPGAFFGALPVTTYAGRWEHRSILPTPRSRGVGVAFPDNGRIYGIGGEFNNGDTGLPIVEYDPLADRWTTRTNLQVGVSNVGAALIGNAIYVPGGYSSLSGQVQSILQVFYPLDNRVDVVATDPLPAPRMGAGVAAYNGKLYVIGGSANGVAPTNTVFEYDPSRPAGSRWQTKAPMPTTRFYLGAATLGNVIYAVGGLSAAYSDLATVEAYDPTANTWQARSPLNLARGGVAVAAVAAGAPGCGGYLYAFGGGWTDYTATVERYDPSANSWAMISPLTEERRSLYAAYSAGTYSLLAFGGWQNDYEAITEAVSCAGNLAPLTPTPTAIPTPCALSFSDVPPDNTFYPYIRCLACRGILGGYSDGTFRPNNNITRGQIAKIVSNAAGFNGTPSGQSYEDVLPGSTFYLWVERLTRLGIISGYGCGHAPGEPCVPPDNRPYFRPNSSATRGQIAKIVSNAAGFNETPLQQTYEDVPSSNPFYLYIERLTSRGIMSGYPCGGPNEPCDPQNRPYFRPGSNATRGQTAKIVANTFYPNCQTPR